jgi:carbamoyl-phosphate synthase large subunit
VLEVNPRASRTVPFVSKAIGVPLAKVAVRCMVGRSLAAQGFTREIVPAHVNVKEAVFPFIKFPGVDTVLGPEMKSTGEVMGIDGSFGAAFAKAQIAAATLLPAGGRAFISVPQADYAAVVPVARRLARAGFTLLATRGTAAHLRAAGLAVEVVNKVSDGGPHIVDALRRGEVALVVNTPAGADSQRDAFHIRRTALECRVPYFTTLAAAAAAAEGIDLMGRGPFTVRPLQEHHRRA